MKAPRLHTEIATLTINSTVPLDADSSRYLTRVLRRKTGDGVTLFNGDGHDYPATVTQTSPEVLLNIDGCIVNEAESPLGITLVQSLAKGTKLDLVIQKATELGVNKVVPVIAERSVMKIDEKRLQKRLQHWRGVAISACGQCHRSRVPAIEAPQQFNDWLAGNAKGSIVLHPEGEQSISSLPISDNHCQILVGPEGGFTGHEIRLARDHGVAVVNCGPRVLRTETAGFTAVAILQSRYGDL